MEITVTPELEAYVASKVASGRYASPGEVFAAGLEALQAEEQSIQQWLIDEVVPAYDEMKAHPEVAVPIDEVFADLRRHHMEQVELEQVKGRA
jgi:putative addiction module CopG family antidote